jgi:hypothetical protein
MYKVEKYQDVMPGFGKAFEKRFELIRKLSKDFTVSNKTALEMDELLFEQVKESINSNFKMMGEDVFSERYLARESAKTLIEEDVSKKM